MRILYCAWDLEAWRGTLYQGLRKAHTVIPMSKISTKNKYVSWMKALLRLFKSKYDVILGDYVVDMGYFATRLGKLLKMPVVIYARGGEVDTRDPYFYSRVNVSRVKYALENADIIMCVSKYLVDRVLEIDPKLKEKVRLVYNGIDTNRFRPPLSKRKLNFKLLDVGNIIYKKGFDTLIMSLPILVRHHPQTRLEIVGKGSLDERKRLMAIAKKLEVNNHIVFRGYIFGDELIYAYQTSDLLVHTPRKESFGVVLIEAMASGLPVVATNIGGIPEIVPPDFLVPVNDHQRTARKILEIFSLDDDDRWKIGMRNRRIVEKKFTLDHQINGVTKALEEAIARSK